MGNDVSCLKQIGPSSQGSCNNLRSLFSSNTPACPK